MGWTWDCSCGASGEGKDYEEANEQFDAHDCPHGPWPKEGEGKWE